MRYGVFLVLPTCMICAISSKAKGWSAEVQQFLYNNGHRHVNIVQNPFYVKWTSFKPKDIYFSSSTLHKAPTRNDMFSIYIFEDGKDNLEEFLNNIEMRKIKMSLLLFAKPWQSEEKNDLVKLLNQKQLKTLFYAAVPSAGNGALFWFQIFR